MAQAFISLGSNIGNKIEQLNLALNHMRGHHIIIQSCSAVYQTAAWGNTNQQDFLNAVVKIKTELSPLDLLQTLLHIELTMGRKRGALPWQPRTIDLDILYYDNCIMHSNELTIPHPYLTQRRFTLVPLNDIAACEVHPEFNLSNSELLLKCKDKSEVHKTNDVLLLDEVNV